MLRHRSLLLALITRPGACVFNYIVTLDALKRRATPIAVVLHRQQLLAEKGEQLGLLRTAEGAANTACLLVHYAGGKATDDKTGLMRAR